MPTRSSTACAGPAARWRRPRLRPRKHAADAAADLGERLLALVAEAQGTGVDPEQALRDAVRRRL